MDIYTGNTKEKNLTTKYLPIVLVIYFNIKCIIAYYLYSGEVRAEKKEHDYYTSQPFYFTKKKKNKLNPKVLFVPTLFEFRYKTLSIDSALL